MNSLRRTFFVCFFISTYSLFAQDYLYLNNGQKMAVKISELSDTEVRYKRWDNLSGPIYSDNILNVSKIEYENGAIDNFEKRRKGKKEDGMIFNRDYGRNMVSIDALTLLFQNVELSYERFVDKDMRLGLKIPLSINMLGTTNQGLDFISNSRNVFHTGLDLNFYPKGQSMAAFYLGPSVKVGAAMTQSEFYDDTYGYIYETRVSEYFSFLLRFGLNYMPLKELSINTSFGIGTRRYIQNIPQTASAIPTANFRLSLGYRF
jgi:hypothetical protein